MAFWVAEPVEGSNRGCFLHLSCVCTSVFHRAHGPVERLMKKRRQEKRQHLLSTHHFSTNTTSSIKQSDNLRCHFKSTASGAGHCEPAINGTAAVSGHFRDVDRRWPAADRQGHSHSLHVTSGHAPAYLPLVACASLDHSIRNRITDKQQRAIFVVLRHILKSLGDNNYRRCSGHSNTQVLMWSTSPCL